MLWVNRQTDSHRSTFNQDTLSILIRFLLKNFQALFDSLSKFDYSMLARIEGLTPLICIIPIIGICWASPFCPIHVFGWILYPCVKDVVELPLALDKHWSNSFALWYSLCTMGLAISTSCLETWYIISWMPKSICSLMNDTVITTGVSVATIVVSIVDKATEMDVSFVEWTMLSALTTLAYLKSFLHLSFCYMFSSIVASYLS